MTSGGGFPRDFVWGVATSAYQIEGSPLADGAGPSIWHRFSHTPGATHGGDTGDVACDHYRRWREDVELMRGLGVDAYRFSLSWGRLLPLGTGAVNPAGVAFYSRLVDALLEAGIKPMATLYHWDLPAALEDRGGWLNPEIVRWFADYAELAFREFGDRVPLWATINEPWMVSDSGYLRGAHPPAHRDPAEAARAAHHLLLAHAAAVERFRTLGRGAIGLVVNLEPKHPATDDPKDVAAAARADAYMNRQYLDPVCLGRYPDELPAMFGEAWPRHAAADLDRIRQPVDFLGINYYSRGVTRHDPAAPVVAASAAPTLQAGLARTVGAKVAPRAPTAAPARAGASGAPAAETERTAMGWEVYPDGLREILCWINDRYGKMPLYVTENGAAFDDPSPGPDGIVEDPLRVDYFRRHIEAARQAIGAGVDLRGYFAWSLLDNFEWQQGYAKRFGLVHVDFASQRRTLKRSALHYREVIRTRGAAVEAVTAPAPPSPGPSARSLRRAM